METQNTTAPAPAPQYANRNIKYYHTHKADPGFRERLAEVQRNYYQRNKDRFKQKALERYYRLKWPELAIQGVFPILPSPAV